MSDGSNREIYFHVGLGKVASSYLQQRFFPKLKGIRYISTHKYKKSLRIIQDSQETRFLVSREFDRQFEDEVKWFSSHFPNARVIIIFRRHDSWIASQYRRFVKNGLTIPFNEFFNLDESRSSWEHRHIEFYWKLEMIEEYFGSKPLVLFHDDLKKDSLGFLQKLSSFMGATFDPDSINLNAAHSSYSEKQLRVLQAFCKRFKKERPKGYSNKWKHWMLYRPWWALFHLIMYAAKLFPNAWVPEAELCPADEMKAIREAYEEDWQKVQAYAKANNPT